VRNIVVKNPITQEISTSGSHGTFTAANVEKQRSYNLPQWKALTEEMQHQPPARRGENRKRQEKPKPVTKAAAVVDSAAGPAAKCRPGRPKKNALPTIETDIKEEDIPQTPLTPTSPGDESKSAARNRRGSTVSTVRRGSVDTKAKKPRGRQPKASLKATGPRSVAERRKYNQHDTVKWDDADFDDFDYTFHGNDEFTAERCQELETLYWKSLTYAPPMYGADMPGSLFDDTTTEWNVAKLPNLLDVLGEKVPGVNTAYLYLGMWKATFAWHLEDVDLYSINYIHFGAPKQWYSISQEDARKFEKAMQSIWPTDAKQCGQFLRHKTYLISPERLQSQFNIKVNKLVHCEGEFVITYPYGYHSGYNLGYNCAESVNFANEAWLEYGRIAKKCDCEADSVWVSVEDIERKLRGEATPEYYEVTDDDEDMEDDDHTISKLPTPPASVKAKSRKRKRDDKVAERPARPVKKIKIRIKVSSVEPCVLCPNHLPSEPLLNTDTGKQAHRVCALYTPETYLSEENDLILGTSNIDKARMDLKCSFCRAKKGACFQCSSKKCTRAYHATCAAAAGVQVDYGPTPFYSEDGTEYITEGYDFRCRYHRAKRGKNTTMEQLDANLLVRRFAKTLLPGDTIQAQHLGGEIFAGTVIENRANERAVVIDILPEGDRVEVDYKYILVLDPHDSQLPKPSANAKVMPAHMTAQLTNSENAKFGPPQEGHDFTDGNSSNKWAEYSMGIVPRNPYQVKIDFSKQNRIWYYLGKKSTDARPQYTHDVAIKRMNPAAAFLETVRPAQPGPVMNPPRLQGLPAQSPYATQAVRKPSQTPLSGQPRDNFVEQKPYSYNPKADQSRFAAAPNYQPSLSNVGFAGTTGSAAPYSNARPNMVTNGLPPLPSGMSYGGANGLTRNQMEMPSLTASFNQRRPSSLSYDPFRAETNYSPSALQRDILSDAQKLARVHNMSTTTTTPTHRTAADLSVANLTNNATLGASVNRPGSKDLEFVTSIQPYRYLINSYCRRPKIYDSPYKPDGGFSNEYSRTLIKSEPDTKSTSQHYQEIVPPNLYPIVPPAEQEFPTSYALSQAELDSAGMSSASSQFRSPWATELHNSSVVRHNTYCPGDTLPPMQQSRRDSSFFPSYQTSAQFSQDLKLQQQPQNSYPTNFDRLYAQIKQSPFAHQERDVNVRAGGMSTAKPSGMGIQALLNPEEGV